MNIRRTEVLKSVSSILAPIGFKREKTWWKRPNNGVGSLLDLQKSNYSGLMYVNIGFWLMEEVTLHDVRDVKCHVRFRLTSLLDDEEKKRVEYAFNIDDDANSGEIEELVELCAVPILNSVEDKASLVFFIEKWTPKGLGLTRQALDLIKVFRN